MKKAPNHIGVLWKRTSEKGDPYFVGRLNVLGATQEIIIFEEKKQTGGKYPDYNIFINTRSQQRRRDQEEQEVDGNR